MMIRAEHVDETVSGVEEGGGPYTCFCDWDICK